MTKNKDNHQKTGEKTHRSIFLKEVKDAFPDISKAINSQHGLLHCEMHEFRYYVESLVVNHEKEKLIKAFQILERHFLYGNLELVSAISVSFLEHFDLDLAKAELSWAYSFFPHSLKEPYEQLRKYHNF